MNKHSQGSKTVTTEVQPQVSQESLPRKVVWLALQEEVNKQRMRHRVKDPEVGEHVTRQELAVEFREAGASDVRSESVRVIGKRCCRGGGQGQGAGQGQEKPSDTWGNSSLNSASQALPPLGSLLTSYSQPGGTGYPFLLSSNALPSLTPLQHIVYCTFLMYLSLYPPQTGAPQGQGHHAVVLIVSVLQLGPQCILDINKTIWDQ